MYEVFYQLSADPFRLSPDPGFCFQHRTYRKAMTYMLHALHRAEGFIMITGQPGTGKTTLVNDLIRTLKSDRVSVAKIVSTQLTADDLLNLVAYSYKLNPEGGGKAKVLVQLERFLKQQYQQGRRPLLIVDEAQDMGEEALEELRLLTNMLVGNHQLLQVFLVGQEQLRETVHKPALVQLSQRLIAATRLEPLDSNDTRTYIKHRLRCVNWTGDPLLSTETYTMIQRYSQGIPRRINQICSRLFLHGSIEEKHRLGLADLKLVVEELQQELLLPADTEDHHEALSWPAEPYQETYEEEEPQTSPPAPGQTDPPAPDKSSPPGPEQIRPPQPERDPLATVILPETEKAEQKPPARTGFTAAPRMSSRAADTALRRPASKPVSVARRGPRARSSYASFKHKKRRWQPQHLALVPALGRYVAKTAALLRDRTETMTRTMLWGGAATVLLVTALLVTSFREGDIDRTVGDQETLALNQAATLQAVQAAREDSEVSSVQRQAEIPPPGEPTPTDTPSNPSEADGNARRDKEQVTALDIETRQPPALERDVIAIPAPTFPLATGEADEAEAPDIPINEIAEQSPASQDEPEPSAAQEAARLVVLSGSKSSQTEQAAAPVPVKEVVALAPPISREEKIAEFLDHGRRTLKRDQLLFPENNSAYYYYQRVLKLDPRNSDARHGIEQVAARYAALATEALDNNDKEKAMRYIARGFRISPNDEELLALQKRINTPEIKVASEQPPPVVPAPEPEPKSESKGVFKRLNAIFATQPNEKIDNPTQTHK